MKNNQYDRIYNILLESDRLQESPLFLPAAATAARTAGQLAVKGVKLAGRGVVAGGKLAVRGLRAVGRTVTGAAQTTARKAGQGIKRKATDKVTDMAVDRAKQKIDQRLHGDRGEEDIR